MNISYIKSKSFYLPSLLFLFFALLYFFSFQQGDYKYYSMQRMLTQWDGQHYLSIARDGYEKFTCQYSPENICGNIGWFPFYPLVGSTLSFLPIPINILMIGLSWLSFWLALLLLYRFTKKLYSEKTALWAVIALLIFPSSFYFLTVFPYSMYLLITMLIFTFLFQRQYLYLIPLTAILAVTYPSGIVIVLPLLYTLWQDRKTAALKEKLLLSTSVISVGLGLTLYCLYNYIAFDDFFLYKTFQSQSYYAHKATFPFWTMYETLTTLPISHVIPITLIFIIIVFVLFYRKQLDIRLQLFMFGILLFTPSAGTTDCYYRHIVVAFPLFILIGNSIEHKARKYLLPIYIAASLLLIYFLYFPLYKMGNLM